jgi:TRAP-type C4-dicarboxylate transport system permease small subunit
MNLLRSLGRVLTRIEGWCLVLFLSVMVVLAFLQVVLRNLFGTGFNWGDPLVRQMVMWVGFTGAAIAASNDRHISIDALTRFIGERPRHAIKTATNAFGAVVCYYLTVAAWGLVMSEKEAGGETFLGIPQWGAEAIIPAGYVLLCTHFALNAIESAILAFGRKKAKA